MQQDTRRADPNETAAMAPTDPDAFLLWASQRRREEGKLELSRGRAVCNTIHASRGHSRVCANLLTELVRLLDRDRFDVAAGEFAVRTKVGARSPDIVVDVAGGPLHELSTAVPIFVAEVISPSTIGTDFTEKLEEYTGIDTLQTYLVCSQDEPRAWMWSRAVDGAWPKLPVEHTGRDGSIPLGGLNAELAMAAMFRGIPDAPTLT